MRLQHLFSLVCASLTAAALTGCGSSFVSTPSDKNLSTYVKGQPFGGTAMGGQQPIGTSRLYLFAAGTSGYGGASVSLIKAAPGASYPSQLDSNGNYYITTSYPSGSFNFAAGQYQCSPGQQVYLYSVGGNVGNGANSAVSEMAILGTCTNTGYFSQLPTSGFLYMNEVSTVAAAYALAGFATDATHISSGPSALAATGLQNAFNIAPNLYNIGAGPAQGALAVTAQGDGEVPQAEINSIADMLASCINSGGSTSTNCSTLFSSALSGGTTGTTPTDTSTAAINIAHHPGAAATALATLFTDTSPFQPIVTTIPFDFSIIITYPDGDGPSGIAVDGAGNVWVANTNGGTVTELASNGALLSGTSGYLNAAGFVPDGIALDTSGNAWVSDDDGYLVKITPNGASFLSYFEPDYVNTMPGIALDSNGTVWVSQANPVTSALQTIPGPGFTSPSEASTTGGGYKGSFATGSVAIDTLNNAYIANYKAATTSSSGCTGTCATATNYGTVAKFNSSRVAQSPATSGNYGFGYSSAQHSAEGIAIDKNNSFWMTEQKESSVMVGTGSGTSYTITLASGSAAAGVSSPSGIAIDGAGNAWIVNTSGTISALTSTGAAYTGTHGRSGSTYGGGTTYGMSGLGAIAIDGSGNIWLTNYSNSNIYEVVGSATPVVTPIQAGLTSPYKPGTTP